MWRVFGLAMFGFALCTFSLTAVGAQDKDKKDVKKDDKKDPKKFEIPKDAIGGKVKSVDLKAASFTITTKDGKDRTFTVTKETEFWGPKGGDRGTGPEGLKDDTMAKGYDVKVVPAKDGKAAKDVYLPNRKTDTKEDKKADAKKTN